MRRVAAVSELKEHRDVVFDAVSRIRYPDWFDVERASVDDVIRVMEEEVLQWATVVYLCAKDRNDFFILHGVTGGWSLVQVLRHVFTDATAAFQCVQYFLASLFYVYVAQGSPEIDTSKLELPEPTISLVELKREAMARDFDEHVFKLVQVCCSVCEKFPQDQNKVKVNKLACRHCIDEPFFH